VNAFLGAVTKATSSVLDLLNPRGRKRKKTFRNEVVMTCHMLEAWRDAASWMLLDDADFAAPQNSKLIAQ
jgi:hypothetical protein